MVKSRADHVKAALCTAEQLRVGRPPIRREVATARLPGSHALPSFCTTDCNAVAIGLSFAWLQEMKAS
jgi:hypothetical protein